MDVIFLLCIITVNLIQFTCYMFFQSMGICFIGERNFENFILEVRLKHELFVPHKLANLVCFLYFSAFVFF